MYFTSFFLKFKSVRVLNEAFQMKTERKCSKPYRRIGNFIKARNRLNTFSNSRITRSPPPRTPNLTPLTSKLCRNWLFLASDNLLGTSILKCAVCFQFAFLLQQLKSQGLLRTLKKGQLKRSQENNRIRLVINVLFVTLKFVMNLIFCTKSYVTFWLTTLIICIVSFTKGPRRVF